MSQISVKHWIGPGWKEQGSKTEYINSSGKNNLIVTS